MGVLCFNASCAKRNLPIYHTKKNYKQFKHKENGKWHQFNDAFVSECKPEEIINGGDPYLLLYEKID